MNNDLRMLYIFNKLPEKEKSRFYLEMEKAIQNDKTQVVLDGVYISTFEQEIHARFDSLDYENLNCQEFLNLKRKLTDIKVVLDRIEAGAYRGGES